MIKRLSIVFIVVCLLSSPIAVYADVVMGNDFLSSLEKDEIQVLDRRRFVVNGPDGYVIPQQKPGEENEDFTWPRPWTDSDLYVVLPRFENNTLLMMSSTYVHNGEYWGVMEYGHRYGWPGWVPMNHLLVDYIPDDFNKENEDIILFYEAGIIGGVDAQGTFSPDSNITRAEASTIFMNLIDVNKRHSGRTYGN